MNHDDVLKHLCGTVATVYASIGDYDKPSDCFCSHNLTALSNFQHSGETLEYVRRAVLNQLKADGYTVVKKF